MNGLKYLMVSATAVSFLSSVSNVSAFEFGVDRIEGQVVVSGSDYTTINGEEVFITGPETDSLDFGIFGAEFILNDNSFNANEELVIVNESPLLAYDSEFSEWFLYEEPFVGTLRGNPFVLLFDTVNPSFLSSSSFRSVGLSPVLGSADEQGGGTINRSFEFSSGTGVSTVDAWLMEVAIYGQDALTQELTSVKSDSFFLAFNSGLGISELQSALDLPRDHIAPVPTPAAFSLFISALFGLGIFSRKKAKL